MQPGIFSIRGEEADDYRPRSRESTRKRTPAEKHPCKATIAKLKAKIKGAEDALNITSHS